ncbi:MAG: PilN domain-containing protein [candidate division Zixibacteria bacterium]|nr:PilN domain-containing protein [candidate division Zixibacteria bacterium]
MIEINLLPREYRQRRTSFSFDKKMLYIGAALVMFIAVLGATTIYQKHEIARIDNLIDKARIEETRYRKDLDLIDGLTEVKEKILQRLDAVDKLDQRRDFYVSLLEDINRRVPEFLWMSSFTEIPPPPPPDNPKKEKKEKKADATIAAAPAATVGSARIEGYAFNLNAIATFMIAMMKSDYFDNIRLGHTIRERIADTRAYNFAITCDLNYDAADVYDELEDLGDQEFNLSAVNETND